jgi:hemerythrin-like domain-containing protein
MERTLPRPRPWMLVPVVLVLAAVIVRIVFARRAHTRDERRPADVGFMRAMHDAIRRDLDRLDAVAPQVARLPETPKEVLSGWTAFRDALRTHHDAEDDDLWPVLRQHLTDPADQLEVDAMVEEHRAIPAALDAVDEALATHEDATKPARDLAARVREHLDHEERTVLPLLEQHLSRAEWRHWLLTERDRRAPRERPEFLTWVLDEADDADRAAVMAELPRPARVVYRIALRPRYERQHRWQVA